MSFAENKKNIINRLFFEKTPERTMSCQNAPISKFLNFFIFKFALALTLSIINCQLSIAQHYVGVKGGYGAAQGRVHSVWGEAEGAMVWNKYTAGVMWRYYSPQRVWGGVQAELEYQQRGYRIYDGGEPDNIAVVISDTITYRVKTRSVSTVTLPLIWQPHGYLFNRHVRVFASLGVTFSYNLGSGDKYSIVKYEANKVNDVGGGYHWGPQNVTTVESGSYKMDTARDIRWNYGWVGGAGVGVIFDRWEVFAEGRYYYGMSDIMRTDTKYRFNTERALRSELDNIYITMGVFFRLGKGDILEPRRRGRPMPVGSGDFRNIKLPD
jgi:hypothetical protein